MRLLTVIFASVFLLAAPASAGHHKSGEESGKGKQGRFAKTDTNGDGVISRAEFMAVAAKRFDKMDANSDGSLSKDEMKRQRK